MKQSAFTSEYDSALMPALVGDPMLNAPLDAVIDALPPAHRFEQSLLNLLREAVYSYYFAKHASPALASISSEQHGSLKAAIDVVRTSLVKQAVIGIATTIDLTTGRTMSLPDALRALTTDLKKRLSQTPDDETRAAAELVQHIRAGTNADTVLSLKYVRHLRNKWASHSSLDRTVDNWADADAEINFVLLEDALVRMVNAFQDLGTLVSMSQDLRDIEAQGRTGELLPDGTAEFRATISWSGAAAIALVAREEAKKSATALAGRLA